MNLKVNNEFFIDLEGRSVLLRGVNLSASSKVPSNPNGATHLQTDFSDHKDVSFVGRPFPIKEADGHFTRLKHWGFNCLRFLVTWEAIEHEGPGKYDKEYLDYIEEILKIAESYGLYTFINPHQDVWSRMSGGDGAPGWTFEKVGLDFAKFNASEAAFIMQYRYDPNNPKAYSPMYWTGNENRLANGTMFTLFFGGKDFAPLCQIDGVNAQDYLQNHFFDAMKQIAIRVKDNPQVLGFDTLNEPNPGWIEKLVDGSNIKGFKDILGYAFTPIDAMLTGAGYTRSIGFHEIKRFGIKETKCDDLNPNNILAWFDGVEPIWKREGVWDLDDNGEPVILKNDYFMSKNGKKINFSEDYLSPYIFKFTEAIRSVMPESIMFIEGSFEKLLRGEDIPFKIPKNSVNASHWYDVATIGTKRPMLKANYDPIAEKPIVGKKNVQSMFIRHLGMIKELSITKWGRVPTIIGEFGLAFDINNKSAYKNFKTEPDTAWETHINALTMYYNALDRNLLNSTQWNYTPDNTNEWGDQWNLEDLSIFSKDQQLNPNDINSGGRAIKGFCRPHFIRCAGIPLKMEFNIKDGTFYFEFDGKTSITAPTILFIPKIQYPNGYDIRVSEEDIEENKEKQLILIEIKKDGIHTITITRK